MKRIILSITLILVLLSSVAFADLIAPTVNPNVEEVEVVLQCSRAIRYNNTFRVFKNAKGDYVYPISYNGSTYLPIRAISALFSEGITWDGEKNTVFLGKGDVDTTACEESDVRFYVPVEKVQAKIIKDRKISYKNKTQTFKDANGKVVYPISYQGSTYLPVRAISNLFGAKIDYKDILDIVDITK
ncbi:MAG: hypothetical protein IKR04_06070 [Clostridia bacterium]|nr:hypothetical protein [Clostridia bacterium]